MSNLAKNLRNLRKERKLTQEQCAMKLGINRSVVGAYEEGRAEPRVKTLINIAHYFEVSVDDLLKKDLTHTEGESGEKRQMEHDLRILPITVDRTTGKEMIPLVPVRASAGYTAGYGDIDFIESLPQFNMPYPEIADERTYRIFQTDGDSMLPVPDRSYIITRFVEDWREVKDGQCYVLSTKDDGLVYKRVFDEVAESGQFKLRSDNPNYEDYKVPISEVTEIWKALGYTSFTLPDGDAGSLELHEISKAISEIKDGIRDLKKKKKKK